MTIGDREWRTLVLRVFIAALLILIGFGTIDFDKAVDEWRAIYPDDPARRSALHLCYENDLQFDRMSATARADCYSQWLPLLRARQQAREHAASPERIEAAAHGPPVIDGLRPLERQ
jgi:hypothetical protein